jgi:hypothetical protein
MILSAESKQMCDQIMRAEDSALPGTVISGVVKWAGSGEPVSESVISIYTLTPASLIGRAQADANGCFQMASRLHWAGGHDLYVVVLDACGELLQLTRNDPAWLTGPHTQLDIPVTGRWRPPTPPVPPPTVPAPSKSIRVGRLSAPTDRPVQSAALWMIASAAPAPHAA